VVLRIAGLAPQAEQGQEQLMLDGAGGAFISITFSGYAPMPELFCM
jgi:hypothetical protein